jgi:hypothetical protein
VQDKAKEKNFFDTFSTAREYDVFTSPGDKSNIENPFIGLYRHPSSPFFSRKGKTGNERLLSAKQVNSSLRKVGDI